MDASFLTTRNQTRTQALLRLLRWAGPAVLSVFVAWGTVQFAKGREAQRLDTFDKQIEETRKTLENTVSREEFRSWTAEQRERFKELREDLRDLKRSKE